MRISIVIPVYNVAEYIEECLESVASQTYKDQIECLIIDDCSPDNSCEIIGRFMKAYKGPIDFKLIHHEKNKGLSGARNTGIKHSTGDYLYFLDSDDYIMPDCIEKLAEPLNDKAYDFVIGNFITEPINHDWDTLYKLDRGAICSEEKIMQTYFSNQWYVMAWNKLCNKRFLLDNTLLFKEGLIHEDDLWSFQLASLAETMFAITEKTYVYRLRDNSIMTGCSSMKHAKAYLKVSQNMILFTKSINDGKKKILYSALGSYILSIVYKTSLKNEDYYNFLFFQIQSLIRQIPFPYLIKDKNVKELIVIFLLLLPLHLGRYLYIKRYLYRRYFHLL